MKWAWDLVSEQQLDLIKQSGGCSKGLRLNCSRLACADANAYPFDSPPRGNSQQGDSVLNMPLVQLASKMGPESRLLSAADICQGTAALSGCDHKCVHWLQCHTHTLTTS